MEYAEIRHKRSAAPLKVIPRIHRLTERTFSRRLLKKIAFCPFSEKTVFIENYQKTTMPPRRRRELRNSAFVSLGPPRVLGLPMVDGKWEFFEAMQLQISLPVPLKPTTTS